MDPIGSSITIALDYVPIAPTIPLILFRTHFSSLVFIVQYEFQN